MSAATTVRWFSSLMQGAPTLGSNFGDTVALLDAILINGFNTKTPTSISRSGSVVTINFASGHGYFLKSVLRIAGATQTEYNGDWVIDFVDSNNLRFDIGSATPSTPATGTITTKTAPLDWEILFTAANKRVYRSKNTASNRPCLRVDNTQPSGWTTGKVVLAKVTMATGWYDIDTPNGTDYVPYRTDLTSFPDWGWLTWKQSYSSYLGFGVALSARPNNGAVTANWAVYGDDRCFYYAVQMGFANATTDAWGLNGFGDFQSYKPGDLYNAFIFATENYNGATSWGTSPLESYGGGPQTLARYGNISSLGCYFLKSYVGIGNAVKCAKVALDTRPRTSDVNQIVESGYSTGLAAINGPDYGLILHPSYALEVTGAHLRGVFPGLYAIMNSIGSNLYDRTIISGVSGYAGKNFVAQQMAYWYDAFNNGAAFSSNDCRVAFDVTGPWTYT